MVQVGNLSYNQDLNDIWGYVDHEGKEHALVGCANGFSYVDISNPKSSGSLLFLDLIQYGGILKHGTITHT